MGSESDGRFSRSGVTDSEGKLSEKLQVPVSEELLEKLIGLSVLQGKPRAELARILLIKAVEGELAYLRIIGSIPTVGEGRKGV